MYHNIHIIRLFVTLLAWGYDAGMVGATVAFANTNTKSGTRKRKPKVVTIDNKSGVANPLASIDGKPTMAQLVRLAKVVPYKGKVDSKGKPKQSWFDYIKYNQPSVGLMCITLAHMAGYASEKVAYDVGVLLLRHIKGNNNERIAYVNSAGASPRLHYTNRGEKPGLKGVAPKYKQGYDKGKGAHPKLFGTRTELGNDYTIECRSHKTAFDKCAFDCEIRVAYKGKPMLALVKRASSRKPKANDTTNKPNEPNESNEQRATRERRERAEQAAQAPTT